MKQDKRDIPTRIETPDAVARQQTGFGDASDYGELSGEYFTFAAETDITPLLAGLEDDHCQCPHWGYVVTGSLGVSYTDGTREETQTGELFYWPPGHTVRAYEDSEIVMFSPQSEHSAVIEHLQAKIDESA